MLNVVLYKSCGNWIHRRSAIIKRVSNRLAIDFECRKCKGYHKNIEDQKEKLFDDVKTVAEFSYVGNTIKSGGGCVAAVTSRTRLGWVKFRECQDFLCRKKIKGIVHKSCVRSAILYGSKTLSIGENEIGILQGTV